MNDSSLRRRVLTGIAASLVLPAHAQVLRPLAAMSDGPYYPPRSWRDGRGPWAADLTRVKRGDATLTAAGEHLSLELQVVDRRGKALDGVVVEIWQCDVHRSYHHPDNAPEKDKYDEGFAGYGAATTGANGAVRFRTIRPVPYSGNSPHIHLKLQHPAFGSLTSRLWVDGDPGNARDYNWVQTELADRPGLAFKMQAAPADSGLRWVAAHRLTMPI
jgi:protocatechuate 3,4-dioxygenase beta subunit